MNLYKTQKKNNNNNNNKIYMHFLAFTSQDNGHISPIFFLKVKFLIDNKTCHNLQ